jgi:hypothetical protein
MRSESSQRTHALRVSSARPKSPRRRHVWAQGNADTGHPLAVAVAPRCGRPRVPTATRIPAPRGTLARRRWKPVEDPVRE